MKHIVEALEARCLLAIGVDDSFGDHGVVATQFPAAVPMRANDSAIQSDGKIVMAGRAEFPGQGAFALTRLNADGSLDTSFGDAGRVITKYTDYCCRETDG